MVLQLLTVLRIQPLSLFKLLGLLYYGEGGLLDWGAFVFSVQLPKPRSLNPKPYKIEAVTSTDMGVSENRGP